jgi:hypothetical protein
MPSFLARLALLFLLAAAPAAGQGSPWTDLGGGLAGAQGIPSLQGTGALSPGTPGSFVITGTPPFAPTLLFFSLLEVHVPLKGGFLAAYPPIAEYAIMMGPSGITLPWAAWGSALPPGVDMYFQLVIKDPAAVHGASITNLLRGTTQP